MAELSARPLLDTAPDAGLYVRNEEILMRLAHSVKHRMNVLILGARGVGKTTTLHQLRRELRKAGDDRPFPIVSGAVASSAVELLRLVQTELQLALPEYRPLPSRRSAELEGEAGDLLDLTRQFREIPEEVVVAVDGLPSAKVGHTIFGRLRDELWQAVSVKWIVATDLAQRSTLMRAPADAFFEATATIHSLSTEALWRLLTVRAGDELQHDAIAEIVETSDGNPRRAIQLAALALAEPGALTSTINAATRRRARADELGRPASMLVAEMEGRGPVSASDEELLTRLGWTRPRAVQVLGQLVDAGLARSFPDREHPRRRLYELTEPEGSGTP